MIVTGVIRAIRYEGGLNGVRGGSHPSGTGANFLIALNPCKRFHTTFSGKR